MANVFSITTKGARELDKIEREGKKSGRITVATNTRRWILRTLIKRDQSKSNVVKGVSQVLKVSDSEVSERFNSARRSGLIRSGKQG